MSDKNIWDMTDEEIEALMDKEQRETHAMDYYLERIIPFMCKGKWMVTGWDATKKGKIVITYKEAEDECTR